MSVVPHARKSAFGPVAKSLKPLKIKETGIATDCVDEAEHRIKRGPVCRVLRPAGKLRGRALKALAHIRYELAEQIRHLPSPNCQASGNKCPLISDCQHQPIRVAPNSRNG